MLLQLPHKALEVSLWLEDSQQHVTFLGEVLFDLDPGNVSGSETWYSLASHDDNSGELMWTLVVYPRKKSKKAGSSLVFIKEMTAIDDGKTLSIRNEHGEEFRVDLETRTVTKLSISGD